MSATVETRMSASTSSLASSATFRTFAIIFAISTPAIYVICELANWPLFTFHPAVNRIDLGYAAGSADEGPAMHWYGWTANTLIGAAVLGLLATRLPASTVKRIPLSLVWIVPLVAIPIMIYSLRFYWRW
jgi:hypothetical protein